MQIKSVNKTLIFFLFAHLFAWTIIPSVSNNNLPLDTIEALAWSSKFDWGYIKHPPFSAWSTEFFYRIFENQDWAYYFLSQIFVVLAFFITFKFSEDFFENKTYSLISILLLEGIYFYNFTTPEFNVNVCQLPFWALTVYYCWKGIKLNDNISWLLFGVFAAFGILSKYLFIYLLVAIDIFFIYLIVSKKFNFKCLISLVTFILILLPHLIWLYENNFTTFSYALHRTGIENSNFFTDHISHPLIFLGKQIGILTPFLVMLLFIIPKFKIKLNFKDKKLLFLVVVNIVPIILIFLTSVILGVKIRTMWMTPFYLFMGVLFVYIYKKKINLKKLKYFFSSFLILFVFSLASYYFVSMTQTNKRTDYPGKKISKLVNKEWENFTKSDKTIIYKKIDVIGWDEWFAGNLSYHLGGNIRHKVYMENFVDAVVYRKNQERNFILIGNSEKVFEVCSLPGLKDYLTRKLNIVDHQVCFLLLKSGKQ